MKIYFILIPILIISCFYTTPVKQEIVLKSERIIYLNQSFDITTVTNLNHLHFFWKDKEGKRYKSLENLKQQIDPQTLLFAMNGGMYLKDGTPQGLYVSSKIQHTPIDTIQKAYGNFYLQPNGVFAIANDSAIVLTTKDFIAQNIKPSYATQSGPMLVIDNDIHPVFRKGSENVHIRNGVGINEDGNVVFAISNQKVNLYDFAALFKEQLKCKNALYLDGFVSKAYIPELKRSDAGGNFGVIIGVVK